MIVLEKIKENIFFFIVLLAYGIIMVFNPSLALESVNNSGYYIKEMLMIMPAIFLLTALLELWVPKESIMEFLGKDSGIKGVFFSFVIGSVSAGPVYAAFPLGVMLHKKGASIRNIVIILSSWAVIKIPMLLNEAKFLGLKFMGIRWILTVLAILVFSYIMDKLIDDKDLPKGALIQEGVSINKKACMGCNLCAEEYPEIFEMKNNKAIVKEYDEEAIDKERLEKIIEDCPVNAIEYGEK